MCGDSTRESDVRRLMDGVLADLVLTDPPYNVDYEGKAGKIENDAMEKDDFEDFLFSAFSNCERVTKEGGAIYVWYASTSQKSFQTALEMAGFPPHQILIWVKD